MGKLHILFLASWYPNRNAPALGNFIQRHAQAAALHHTVSVIHLCAGNELEEGKYEIEETHHGNLHEYGVYYGKVRSRLPVISQLKRRSAYRDAVQAAAKLAAEKNGKPDLLHVHVIWPAAVAALQLADELDVPLLISEHWSGYLPEDGNYKGVILQNLSRRLADRAAHITVVSKRMQEAMLKHGLGKNFSLLPNAVDTELFSPGERHETLDPPERRAGVSPDSYRDETKLLHVSMLVDREKNISGLLRVMEKLKSRPEITLHIAGDGPERETHEKLAETLGVLNKTVFFKGFKTAEKVAEEMQQADALIMFSHFEGMPVTIIEAQCCGLPVIATKTGAIPEMVNAQQGILVEPGDEAALEKAILTLMEQRDTFSAGQIRSAAAARYSMEAVGAQLDRLYRSILEKHGR